MDVIHRIAGLSKVGVDPSTHFVGKNLDRKKAAKLTKEFNLSKGTKAYDSMDIQDHALRFIVQFLTGQVLRKRRTNKVPTTVIELAA